MENVRSSAFILLKIKVISLLKRKGVASDPLRMSWNLISSHLIPISNICKHNCKIFHAHAHDAMLEFSEPGIKLNFDIGWMAREVDT